MGLLILLAAAVLGFLAYRAWKTDREGTARQGRPRITERLTDPREAAAILLVQQAAYEGHVSIAHKEAICAMMADRFEIDQGEAEGLYSFGRMAIGQIGDAADSLRRLLEPVRARCTLDEMKDLAAMLVQVGETGGPMNDAQRRLVDKVRQALSLPHDDQASL